MQQNCATILDNFELSMDNFYKMNPSVGSDCSGLALGAYYCILTTDIGPQDPGEGGIPPSPTSTTPPVGSGTPTPIQVSTTLCCLSIH